MSYNLCVIFPTLSSMSLFVIDVALISSPDPSVTSSLRWQSGPGSLGQALSGLPQSGKCSGADAERCQRGHKRVPLIQPLHQQQNFWGTSQSNATSSKSIITTWQGGDSHVHAVSPCQCIMGHKPGCCGCCRECITITFISCPFKDTGEKWWQKEIISKS